MSAYYPPYSVELYTLGGYCNSYHDRKLSGH